MFRFKPIYFVIFLINIVIIKAEISDRRLCGDPLCKEVVSTGITVQGYPSISPDVLSFGINQNVKIFSKEAGSNTELWGVEINGKRGYAPRQMIKELKVIKSREKLLLVPTEAAEEKDVLNEEQKVPLKVQPNKVQEAFEVVDGTTVYNSEPSSPTASEDDVKPNKLSQADTINDNLKDVNNLLSSKVESGESVTTKTNVVDSIGSNSGFVNNNSEDYYEYYDYEENKDDYKNEEVYNSNEKTTFENVSPTPQSQNKGELLERSDEVLENISQSTEDFVETANKPSTGISFTETKEELKNSSSAIKNHSSFKEQPLDSSVVDNDEISAGNTETNEEKIITENFVETLNNKPSTETPLTETKEEPKNSPSVIEKNNSSFKEQPLDSHVVENDEISALNIETNEEKLTIEINDTEKSQNSEKNNTQTNEIVAEDEDESKNQPTTVASLIEEVQQPILEDITENPVKDELKNDNQLKFPTLGLFGKSSEMPKPEEVPHDVKENKTEDVNTSEQTELTAEDENEATEGNLDLAPSLQPQNMENPIENLEESSNLNASEQEIGLTQKEDIDVFPKSDNSVDIETNEPTRNEEAKEPEKVVTEEKPVEIAEEIPSEQTENSGLLSGIFEFFGSFFKGSEKATSEEISVSNEVSYEKPAEDQKYRPDDQRTANLNEDYCHSDSNSCPETKTETKENLEMDFLLFNTDILLYLATTAISVIIFLIGYTAIDKSKREGPLVAKINKLEKELLLVLKENELMTTNKSDDNIETLPNALVENLKQELIEVNNAKAALEEQIQSLEKELENSTEVGIELNKMLSDILSSEKGSDVLKTNIEQLQRQLIEQQTTINTINESLAQSEMENHELKLEIEINNKKVNDLQSEVDKLLQNVWKIEEEKDQQQNLLENQITHYKTKYEEIYNKFREKEEQYDRDVNELNKKLQEISRDLNLKTREFSLFKEACKFDEDGAKSFLEVSKIRAELDTLRNENQSLGEKLQKVQEAKVISERNEKAAIEEMQHLRVKYEQADKIKVEAETKLEVLSTYFKEKEAQLQKEISKHEDMWAEKQGEATSSTERIKFLQEQLQNLKSQNESLKQEIINQEVELKSQISVLEKKVHENWVTARQAERKLEDAKHEASQLRHRLTLRERSIQEDKGSRLLSPLEQNGDLTASPLHHHHHSAASPPPLYPGNNRDHITKSPPIPPPGLPFLPPPPPGVPPFLPHPIHGVPPLLPPLPPPNLFPGDHRPPPLGRMSSPPPRFSPTDSRAYSPYTSRHSSSPPSDSEYGVSPPQRGYSPFNDRREYKRVQRPPSPPQREYSPFNDRREYKRVQRPSGTNGRKRQSSDSINSNESSDMPNRHHNSKV